MNYTNSNLQSSISRALSMSRADELLATIHLNNPELQAEDAFVVPQWFYQQNAWVTDPAHSDNAVYNYPLAIRISGSLDTEALQQSLQLVLQRHAVLRSVFRVVDGELLQIVTSNAVINIPIIDLDESGREPIADLEGRARQMATHTARKPFNLSHGPLLRTVLFRLGREDHVLLLITHHLVYDDWSSNILIRELAEFYSSQITGRPAVLPTLSFTYGDFARWLQKQMQGKKLENRLDFWTRELDRAKDFHHLRTDFPRSQHRTYRGRCASTAIPEDVTQLLRQLSQQEKVSLFMVLLAAFQALLHTYSNDEDIAVGSCAANRPLSQTEALVGRFGNDLVLRTDMTGDPTFRELFGRVRKTALTAFSYQDLPFGELVKALSPVESARNPLFQVMFIMQDAPKGGAEFADLTLSPFPLEVQTAKYDLNVWLRPNRGIELAFEYNSDLFAAATMEDMLARYKDTLSVMTKNPDARTSSLTWRNARPGLARGRGVQPARGSHLPASGRREDRLEAQLVEIWESVLAKHPISITDDYFELGGTSLLALRLFIKIEEAFGVKMPLVALIEAPTIEKIATLIRSLDSQDVWQSLVAIHPSGRRPPLFCAHGQSGNLLIYRSLARHLGPDQPVYGLQPQGLDGRQAPLATIEEMAAKYVKDVRSFQPRGPYFLAGYCMGGALALEMAQQLQQQGQTVSLVAMLDTYNFGKLRITWLDKIRFGIEQAWFGWKHFLGSNSADKLSFLQRRFDDIWSGSSKLEICNERASLGYVAKEYRGRILHVRPLRQFTRYHNPELGWDRLARGDLEIFTLPIYPGQMFEEPIVRDLAFKLRASMDEALEMENAISGQGESPVLAGQ
jgi:acyl carrier protein